MKTMSRSTSSVGSEPCHSCTRVVFPPPGLGASARAGMRSGPPSSLFCALHSLTSLRNALSEVSILPVTSSSETNLVFGTGPSHGIVSWPSKRPLESRAKELCPWVGAAAAGVCFSWCVMGSTWVQPHRDKRNKVLILLCIYSPARLPKVPIRPIFPSFFRRGQHVSQRSGRTVCKVRSFPWYLLSPEADQSMAAPPLVAIALRMAAQSRADASPSDPAR